MPQFPIKKNKHVHIVARGHSVSGYKKIADADIWTISVMSFVLDDFNLAFWMDDLRVMRVVLARDLVTLLQEQQENVPSSLVVSSRNPEIEGVDCLVFPLKSVLSWWDHRTPAGNAHYNRWLNSSIAYALAFAGYAGYKKVFITGVDFINIEEKGYLCQSECVHFWIARLIGLGVEVVVNPISYLCETNKVVLKGQQHGGFYGYANPQPDYNGNCPKDVSQDYIDEWATAERERLAGFSVGYDVQRDDNVVCSPAKEDDS